MRTTSGLIPEIDRSYLLKLARTVTVNEVGHVGVTLFKTKQSEIGKGPNEWVQAKALSSGGIW